jgi:hypothetical protein
MPQPELHEPRRREPGLTDISVRDWLAILNRAVKETLDDHIPTMASALAYSTFFAIPSVLLVAVGLSTLVASPSTITTVIDHFDRVMPHQAAQLVGESLHRLDRQGGTTLVLTIVGFRARRLVVDRCDDRLHDRREHRVRPEGSSELREEAAHRTLHGGLHRRGLPARGGLPDPRPAHREVDRRRTRDPGVHRLRLVGGPVAGPDRRTAGERSQSCSGSPRTSTTRAGGSSHPAR